MDEVEKARRALKDVVAMLRKLSDQHGSLKLRDPGWCERRAGTAQTNADSSLIDTALRSIQQR